MPVSETLESSLTALAERHPAFLCDMRAASGERRPTARAMAGNRSSPPFTFREGRVSYAVAPPDAQWITAWLEREAAHDLGVTLFEDADQALRVILSPAAETLVAHARWQPALLGDVQSRDSVRLLFEQLPPRYWPWALNHPGTREAVSEAAAAFGESMLAFYNTTMSLAASELWDLYASRPSAAAVLRRGERRLRVLVVASTLSNYQSYCARDLADAIVEAGHDAQLMIVDATQAWQFEVLAALRQSDADAVLVNGRRRDSDVPWPPGLSVIAWDQDYCLCSDPTFPATMHPRDRVFTLIRDWEQDACDAGLPAAQVSHMNMGTNPRIFHPPARAVEPECDVLFVGNHSPFEKYRKTILFDTLAPSLQALILDSRDRLRDWVLSRTAAEPFILPDCGEFLLQTYAARMSHTPKTGSDWRRLVLYFRYRVAHLLLRELFVRSLTRFRLRVYGTGWEEVPEVAPFAQPPITNGPPLLDAIHKARLSLHVHSWTVHHPRLYDTAAAGGLMLVGRVQELDPVETVFTPGVEIDTFGSIPELSQKIEYYLAHPEICREMGLRAAARAASDHTLTQRIRGALEDIRSYGD